MRVLVAGASAAFGPLCRAADKPVTLVVPYAPGGTSDLLGRLIALHLGKALGRNVIVDNRAGAGTAIGAALVARAVPDGDTLLLATSTTLAINPTLYRKLPYDPVRDFAPIALVAAVPFLAVARPSLGFEKLADLVAHAKSNPGKLSYGSAGNGSPQHLGAAMFASATGISLQHVPYKGSAPALQDLLSGQLDLMFTDLAPALPHMRSGQFKALGVTTRARQPTMPDVPTIAESGIAGTQGFEAVAWQCVVAPAAVPKAVIDSLNAKIIAVLAVPAVRARLQELGVEPRTGTPEQIASYIAGEAERWGEVVKVSAATVD